MKEEDIFEDRFWGNEFDWFSLDQDGNIAIFVSAGYGHVPIEVRKNHQAYDLITEKFCLPRLGTKNVWNDYTWYGLYVFDWQIYAGPYLKVAVPSFYQFMPAKLRKQILAIDGLPVLNVKFKKVNSITIASN